MKKFLCVLLSTVLIALTVLPVAQAKETLNLGEKKSKIPVIAIWGDGSNHIVDKDGKQLSKLSRLATDQGSVTGIDDDEAIKESVLNVVKPFLIQGILTDNWEPYYEALEKEMGELFGDIMLDENGEASNGSHLSDAQIRQQQESPKEDRRDENGYFTSGQSYMFPYDWRLDPCLIADELNEYIETLKQTTDCEKVALNAFCLGGNVVAAYLQKYGTSSIHGVSFGVPPCMGVEPISEALSGKFNIDGYAIERILADADAYGIFSLDAFITDSIDLAVKSGLLDTMTDTVKFTIYRKIVKGVTSALALSCMSYPSYWACVRVEDFDDALEYVFGKEGSEKRIEYAKMIEKITYYNETVKKNMTSILQQLQQDANVCVISKYGAQLLPICESRDMIADSFLSVYSSSFGATCGTIYEPLSDKYIANQTKKGLGKYISPDGYIDASTCLFPDNTWFVKGKRHSKWTSTSHALMYTVAVADRQLTVDDFDLTQFMVPCEDNNYVLTAMTVENCNVENWDAQEDAQEQKNIFTRFRAFFESLVQWFRSLKAYRDNKKTNSDT